MKNSFSDIRSEDIKNLCSSKIYERGLNYYKEGRVSVPQLYQDTLSGKVQGSTDFSSYTVRITNNKKDSLIPHCSCPFDFEPFCKHSIALLIYWVCKKEHFVNVDVYIDSLKGKSAHDLLELIRSWIVTNPAFIEEISEHSIGSVKTKIRRYFRDDTSYGFHPAIVEKLEKFRLESENLFKSKNYESAFNLSKVVIEESLKNYGNVDDSSGIVASFIEDYLDLYAKILQKLDVEVSSAREKIHQDNWKLFITDEYGFSDAFSDVIVDSCTKEDDYSLIENLSLKHLEKNRSKLKKERETDSVYNVINLLLDIYEKQGSDDKFRVLCEKELKYSYLRYVRYLETRGEIDEAIELGNKSSIYAKGFYSTQLDIKLGHLESKRGNNARALDHYVSAFDSDTSSYMDPDLPEKIKRISLTLGNWQAIKDRLFRSLERDECYGQMVELYLKEADLETAYKILMKDPTELSPEVEKKLTRMLDRQMPDKAVKMYQIIADKFIQRGNGISYRSAIIYFKKMKKVYMSMGKEKEFRSYITQIRQDNSKKRTLLGELSRI